MDRALRRGAVPKQANQLELDPRFYVNGSDNFELERRYRSGERGGIARFMAYENRANMGVYADALAIAPESPDITQTRAGTRVKRGLGLNIEQELTSELGAFGRAGWSDGAYETWAFTEIERTLSAGTSFKCVRWNRPEDILGIAYVWNGLSAIHADYLAAGGQGFMLGDGALHYAPEQILETYYSFQATPAVWVSPDFQFVVNPGYNRDRGPVEVFGLRLHAEF
jgi:high affinity Mn2+ porin